MWNVIVIKRCFHIYPKYFGQTELQSQKKCKTLVQVTLLLNILSVWDKKRHYWSTLLNKHSVFIFKLKLSNIKERIPTETSGNITSTKWKYSYKDMQNWELSYSSFTLKAIALRQLLC
jgi:hypothetical protein